MIAAYEGDKPIRATKGSAAYDLILEKGARLKAGDSVILPTTLRVQLPSNLCGLILPRSSAFGRGLLMHPGLLDPDYTGVVKVGVYAIKDVNLKKGERIAQLLLVEHKHPCWREFKLPETGHKGFGSTGK